MGYFYKVKNYANDIVNCISNNNIQNILKFITNLLEKCPNKRNWGLNSIFLLNEENKPEVSILHLLTRKMISDEYAFKNFNCYYRVFEILLLFGADPNKLCNKQSPLTLILSSRNLNLELKYYFTQLFIKYKFNITNVYFFGPIFNLIPDIDNKFVYLLFDLLYYNFNYDNFDLVQFNPLFRFKNHKIVQYLIESGESPRVHDLCRNTPIHLLFDKHHINKNLDLYKTLLVYSKYLDFKKIPSNISGQYILHSFVKDNKYKIHSSFQKCLDFLINYGIDINQPDDELKHNVLYYANISQNTKCISSILNCKNLIKILIQFGADINHRNLYLRTVGYNCHLEVFRFLIDNGLNYNLKDITGRSLIFQIIEKDYYNHFASNYLQEFKQKISILIKNGLDLNDTDPEDENILHYIFRQGFNIYKPIFHWLYKKGADLRAKNCDDVSPIDLASNENIIQILKIGLAKNDSTLIQEVLSKFNSTSLDEFFKITILTDPKNVFVINEIQHYISERISVLVNALASKNIPKDCTKYILSKMIYP